MSAINSVILAQLCTGEDCGLSNPSTPFFGGPQTTSYKLIFAVHMLAIIAAFGPTFLYAALGRFAQSHSGAFGADVIRFAGRVQTRTVFPALVVAMLAGIGLIGDSDQVFKFDQAWVSAAFSLVLIMLALSWFFIAPGLKRSADALAKGEEGADEYRSARTATAIATGLFHLGFLIVVILMIWKPGT